MEDELGVGRTPRLRVQLGDTRPIGRVGRDIDVRAEVNHTHGRDLMTTVEEALNKLLPLPFPHNQPPTCYIHTCRYACTHQI